MPTLHWLERLLTTQPTSDNVTIQLLDLRGRQVMSVNQGALQAGSQLVRLNTSELAEGLYVYKVTSGTEFGKGKIMVTKN